MNLPKKRHKKLTLPLLLILFLCLIILGNFLRTLEVNVDLDRESLQSPIITLTEKENLKELLSLAELFPSSITEDENTIQASFSGNLTVFFFKIEDLKPQVDSLHFIFSRAKIEGRLPKIIDLRFNKPIVLY